MDVVRDPLNRLPDGTKSGLISIGLAVEREMDRDSPNFDFLIEVNQHIVAGLTADG
jgi:flagellar biosynthesis regulator FlaF